MGKSCQLADGDRQKIEQWAAAHGTPQQVAVRCRIVLAAVAGESDVAIAEQLSVNRNTVILWRKRFTEQGLDGLWEIAPGRGRKSTYAIDKIANQTGGDNALELPDHGAEPGCQQVYGQQHLARPQSTATSHQNL
jgi:hypothetical protein